MKSKRPKADAGTYHLDIRSDQLIEIGLAAGPLDEEITREEVARWLGISPEWLAIRARCGAELLPRRVTKVPMPTTRMRKSFIYRRGDVIRWLRSRREQSPTDTRKQSLRAQDR